MITTFVAAETTMPKWKAIHEARLIYYKQMNNPHTPTLDETIQDYTAKQELGPSQLFFVWENDKIVGQVLKYARNKQELVLAISSIGDDKFSYFEKELKTHIDIWKKELSKTIFYIQSPIVVDFAKQCSFKEKNSVSFFSLDFEKISKSFLNQILEIDKAAELGLQYSITNSPTEKEISEIVGLKKILLQDMQRDAHSNFEVTEDDIKQSLNLAKETNSEMLFFLLRNVENELVGISDATLKKDNPVLIDQNLTGVAKTYRKKGVALWLKAKSLEHFRTQYPTVKQTRTNCFSSNVPIIKLNQKLGFVEESRKVEMVFVNV